MNIRRRTGHVLLIHCAIRQHREQRLGGRTIRHRLLHGGGVLGVHQVLLRLVALTLGVHQVLLRLVALALGVHQVLLRLVALTLNVHQVLLRLVAFTLGVHQVLLGLLQVHHGLVVHRLADAAVVSAAAL